MTAVVPIGAVWQAKRSQELDMEGLHNARVEETAPGVRSSVTTPAPLESDCSEIPCTESTPSAVAGGKHDLSAFWPALHDVPRPCSCPFELEFDGVPQDEHECLFSSDSSIAFPVSTTEQCATVTRLMPFRGWICPVVPSACAGPSCKPVGDDSFHATLCRSPKSFCRRRQTGPAPLWRR